MSIPNTRFQIAYQDVYFDISQFLKLVDVNINKRTIYIIYDNDQEEWFYNSLQYDNKDTQNVKYSTIKSYLDSHFCSPKLKEIYQILQPEKQFLRTTDETLGVEKHYEYIKNKNSIIDSKKLNEEELQALVDFYYEKCYLLPFYMGFIFYMLYKRLHPNPDYYGVLGRMVFLENGHCYRHFPISIFFKESRCKYINDIYKLFNSLQKSSTPSNSALSNSTGSSSSQNQQEQLNQESNNNEKYFSIKLDKKDIAKIILILAFSVLYYKYYKDEKIKQILICYFQNPFRQNVNLDNVKIKNFKEIREMINELQVYLKDEQQQQ